MGSTDIVVLGSTDIVVLGSTDIVVLGKPLSCVFVFVVLFVVEMPEKDNEGQLVIHAVFIQRSVVRGIHERVNAVRQVDNEL